MAYDQMTADLLGRVVKLTEEVQALRKDAVRYRWLRGDPPKTGFAFWVEVSAGCYLDGAELDAAIDAAMQARGAVGAA